MRKRLLSLLLCAALLLTLGGCAELSLLPSGAQTEPGESSAPTEPADSSPLPAPDFPEQRFSFLKDTMYLGVNDGVLEIISDSGYFRWGEDLPMLSGSGVSQDNTTARPEFYRDGDYTYYYYADGVLIPQTEWGFYHACSRDGRIAIARPEGEENVSVILRDGEVVERLEAGGTDYVMSPGGSAALFLSYPTQNGAEPVAMLWQAGKGLTELGRDIYPVAVADDAKYVYFRLQGASGPLLVQQGADRSTAQEIQRRWVDGLVVFNQDFSEVIAAGERYSYWSVQGRASVDVPADAVHVVLPDKALGRPLGESWSGERCFGVSTFQDALYIDYTTDHWTLRRLHMVADGSAVAETLSDVLDWDDVKLSADGCYAAWRSGKAVWWMDVSPAARREDKKPVQVCEGFDSPNGFAISADGMTVYYVSEEGLQAWRGGETVQIAARGDYGDFYPVGNAVFYLKDRMLYGWNGGVSRCLTEELPWVRVIGYTNDFLLFSSADFALFRVDDELRIDPVP